MDESRPGPPTRGVDRDDARLPEHRRAGRQRAAGRAPLDARRTPRRGWSSTASSTRRKSRPLDRLSATRQGPPARPRPRRPGRAPRGRRVAGGGRPAAASAIATVNELLRARPVVELAVADGALVARNRHVGDALEDALARLVDPLVESVAAGETGAAPDLRERRVPLGLRGYVADRSPALVQHGQLWQPGQGGPPSRPAARPAAASPSTLTGGPVATIRPGPAPTPPSAIHPTIGARSRRPCRGR